MNWTKTVCVGIAFAALVVGAGPIHAGDRFQRLETKTIPFVEALALTTNRKIGAIFAWPSANISHDVVVDFVGGPDYEDASGTGDRPQVSPGELEAMMRFARNPWDDDATVILKDGAVIGIAVPRSTGFVDFDTVKNSYTFEGNAEGGGGGDGGGGGGSGGSGGSGSGGAGGDGGGK
ncbi:MAG TPA: hypothetical protein DD728_15805 [Hyphomonas atlantica]|jgi:uncharacterized membrane protein YgcG|uniref:Uncharacterized protein n=1 Tax=Hyphomonas atlantica TaxID=1280948 RepID=A0A356W9H8_9PROT|nr:hypothetical protein [Hyphomonas atlantica]